MDMKYSLEKYRNAQRLLDEYADRAMFICSLFKDDYRFPDSDDEKSEFKKFIWKHIGVDAPAIDIVAETLVSVSFDLGYETYSGDAGLIISFPYKLMNMDNDEISRKFKVVNTRNSCDTWFYFELKEKENDC